MFFTSFVLIDTRDEFEQAAVSFETHIREEHNMWKYLWFMLYLELKDPISFSGPEHHAYVLMKDRKVRN